MTPDDEARPVPPGAAASGSQPAGAENPAAYGGAGAREAAAFSAEPGRDAVFDVQPGQQVVVKVETNRMGRGLTAFLVVALAVALLGFGSCSMAVTGCAGSMGSMMGSGDVEYAFGPQVAVFHMDQAIDASAGITPELVRSVVTSVDADPDDILIVNGGLETMNLLCQVFISPGDVILCESPSFVHCVEIFEMFEARCIGCEMDDHGIVVEDVEAKIRKYHPKMVYVIPTFQNPSGGVMSLSRRKALLELAERYNVMILEDNPYYELRFAGEHVPTIKSMDGNGRRSKRRRRSWKGRP